MFSESKPKQYLEYGSLPQQAFGQVLSWQLSGGLQLLVPVSSLRATNRHGTVKNCKTRSIRIVRLDDALLHSAVLPPVRVCVPRNPGETCRRPRLERSPWRGPPVGPSSCTPGKVWLSSRMDVSEPCSGELFSIVTVQTQTSVFLLSIKDVCVFFSFSYSS